MKTNVRAGALFGFMMSCSHEYARDVHFAAICPCAASG